MTGATQQIDTTEKALALAGWNRADIVRVKKREIVSSIKEGLTEWELAAGFAMLVKGHPDDLDTIFLDSEAKEESDKSIQQMGRMVKGESEGGEGSIMDLDFSNIELLPAKSVHHMIKAYVNCGPGDELNLSPEEINYFQTLDKRHATKEQVEDILRLVLTKRLYDYQQKGLEGMAPYARKEKNFEPGKELLERTQKLKTAAKVSPEFVKYLIEYPNSKPSPNVKESYGWINFNIDDKPTFSLFHKISWKINDHFYLMCHRHFYVSRGHNSVQSIAASVPVEHDNTLLLYSSRTATDHVGGFGGKAKRVMGSLMMENKMKANLEQYRAHVEKKEVWKMKAC